MNSELMNMAIAKFFDFYKSEVEGEQIDENNVVLSFPIHFSGFHRIEITVTQSGPDLFIISDGAKTLEELHNAGYAVESKLKKRLETISRAAQIRIVHEYLVSESNAASLGSAIQRFVEATKTIGDAYLVQRPSPPKDSNLVNQVAEYLSSQQVLFQIRRPLQGKIEKHLIDFYFPPNGVPGLALSVMGNPSRMAAEAWAFKSSDIKMVNERTKMGIVYDDTEATESSKSILVGIADISVASSEIPTLKNSLQSIGILKED
jgi:hypothetical protein